MGKKRKKHSVTFKAKVALAAIQNEETIAQLLTPDLTAPTLSTSRRSSERL